MAIHTQRARWVQITGVDVTGHRASVAVLDHPENPRYPSHWYYSDPTGRLKFAYINPALLLRDALAVAAGDALRLRYRLLVLDGAYTAVMLDEQHDLFRRL